MSTNSYFLLQLKDLGHTHVKEFGPGLASAAADVHGRSRRPTIINEVQTYASVIFGFL